MSDDTCERLNLPGVIPGWGCCQCKTYNGLHRFVCKYCEHEVCEPGLKEVSEILEAMEKEKN